MAARKRGDRKWSAEVAERSDALDLEKDAFKSESPKVIARSLKRSAERSDRRKSSPFRSAMSMLTFYLNRAGANLGTRRRKILNPPKASCAKRSAAIKNLIIRDTQPASG